MEKVQSPDFLRKVGESLKNARDAKGLALRELAARCGVDHSRIAKMEKGEINFTLGTFKELCKGLGVQPGALLDFELDLDD